ncbi:MAG: hypothetical protein WCJ26_10160 [bacterium]
MKIAIPTDDGIMLSAYPNSPKGYLVLTIKSGEIADEELRWNRLSEMLTSDSGIMYNLKDCSGIILHASTNATVKNPVSGVLDIHSTKEVIITKIIMEYLNTTLVMESNTCCSP